VIAQQQKKVFVQTKDNRKEAPRPGVVGSTIPTKVVDAEVTVVNNAVIGEKNDGIVAQKVIEVVATATDVEVLVDNNADIGDLAPE
ncbi:hypothetical protein A2U01_0078889, partial [Trifolium medium]|nr:hypothetical protein [Trifolium medium]